MNKIIVPVKLERIVKQKDNPFVINDDHEEDVFDR